MNAGIWISTGILAVTLVFINYVLPPMRRKKTWRDLENAMNGHNLAMCEEILDSKGARHYYPSWDLENLRFNCYMALGTKEQAEKQLDKMLGMNLDKKRKAQVAQTAFYYYLQASKDKKAADMLAIVKESGTPKMFMPMDIQYSVFVKKESRYINEVKKMLAPYEGDDLDLSGQEQATAGMYEYLLGLQYGYAGRLKEKLHYLERALAHCEGTPYEDDIRRELEAARKG